MLQAIADEDEYFIPILLKAMTENENDAAFWQIVYPHSTARG
jgi:hypothetical protein